MATTSSQDGLLKLALLFCKKCNAEHTKPVGAKCEQTKQE